MKRTWWGGGLVETKSRAPSKKIKQLNAFIHVEALNPSPLPSKQTLDMETKFREPPLKTLKYVHSCRYISPSPPLVNSSYTRDYFRVNSPLRCKETKIEVERGSPRSPPSPSQILGGVNVGMKTKSWASVVPPPLQTNPKNWDQIQRPPSNMLIHVDISPSPPSTQFLLKFPINK